MENKKNMNIVLAVIICLALVGVLVFISIKNKANMTPNNNLTDDTNIQPANTDDTSNGATPAPASTPATPDATQTGQVAKTGDTVAVNYTGKLADGTVFDSNVDPKFGHVTPFIFTLVIPPADAYGASGQGPIPPNATLTFEVELLAIK